MPERVSQGGGAMPPLSGMRSSGHLGRLARVRSLSFPPSRKDSRNRTAGGKFRSGHAFDAHGYGGIIKACQVDITSFHSMTYAVNWSGATGAAA